MKVLMINSVCGIRSTGRICTDIAASLTEKGHDCKIAYGRENVPEKYGKYAIKIGSNWGVKLHAALSRLFDNSGFCSTRATKKLIKQIKAYDPDIIHLHNLHGYYLNIKVLFKYLKGTDKQVIWTLHDCWAFTGHCSYFDAVGCEKWITGCKRCPQKKNYPKSIFKDSSAKNYKIKKDIYCGVKNMTLVTPSEWLKNLTRNSILGGYPVEVINNGIDLSVFKPCDSDFKEKYSIKDKKIILGVASVWDGRKGFADFIKLSAIVGEDYKIVMVGLTQNQLATLPENIIGITKTDNAAQLAEIYAAADVFFNPTYEDNYPTVNLEAQACGTPVITYATGGSVESVPAKNVVNQGDVEGAYELIKSGKLEVNNGIAGRTAMSEEYLKLYIGVAENNTKE